MIDKKGSSLVGHISGVTGSFEATLSHRRCDLRLSTTSVPKVPKEEGNLGILNRKVAPPSGNRPQRATAHRHLATSFGSSLDQR